MKGNEFKELRIGLGLTQNDLARVLCLSGKASVSNIETGFRKPSKLSIVVLKFLSSLPRKQAESLIKLMEELSQDLDGKE